jgi:hypothetical protein
MDGCDAPSAASVCSENKPALVKLCCTGRIGVPHSADFLIVLMHLDELSVSVERVSSPSYSPELIAVI